MHQVIGQEHRERFVTDQRPGAQDGMAQSQRLMLGDVVTVDAGRGDVLHPFKQFLFAAPLQFLLQFLVGPEVIPDDLLALRGDENEFRDAGADRFFDGVLD